MFGACSVFTRLALFARMTPNDLRDFSGTKKSAQSRIFIRCIFRPVFEWLSITMGQTSGPGQTHWNSGRRGKPSVSWIAWIGNLFLRNSTDRDPHSWNTQIPIFYSDLSGMSLETPLI